MLDVITKKKEISAGQREFTKVLKTASDSQYKSWIGHMGGSFEEPVHWSSKLGIWMSVDRETNRFWNAFGTEEPGPGSNLPITCEINFPFEGINRRIGGVLLTDGKRTYIGHRGKIGGGREGISKSLFLNNYSGRLEEVRDGGQRSKIALIGRLGEKGLQSKVAHFVREVERIKDLV